LNDAIYRRFLGGRQPAVHQADVKFGKGRAQGLVSFDCVLQFDFHQFRFLDQRANPVSLFAFEAGLPDALEYFLAPRIADQLW